MDGLLYGGLVLLFGLRPACLCSLFCDLASPVLRECFKASFAADLATPTAHFGHDLLEKLWRLAFFRQPDGFVYHAPSVLNGIEGFRSANTFWHDPTMARIRQTVKMGGFSN